MTGQSSDESSDYEEADLSGLDSDSGDESANNDAISPTIGIMIGNTNMSVAACRNGKVIIIPNYEGSRQTPAVIAFTSKGRIIGQKAVDQSLANASNTISGAIRMIGKKKLQDLQSEHPKNQFSMSQCNVPVVEVEQDGKRRKFTAEEVAAFLIGKLKDIVQLYNGTNVSNAVIAVPPDMLQVQRKAMYSAARSAGLTGTVTLVDHPVAACTAHGLHMCLFNQKDLLLVLHCGGETTAATVVRPNFQNLKTMGTATNHQLGGKQFDDKLFELCRDKFLMDHRIDLMNSAKDSARLREAVVKAKITLSSLDEAMISIATLHRGKDFTVRITRSELEGLCSDLFKSVSVVVTDALHQSKVNKDRIKKIVLTGGSTRIPNIAALMTELFGKDRIVRSNDFTPDQAVVYGTVIDEAAKSKPKKRKGLSTDQKYNNKKRRVTGEAASDVIGIDLGTTYSCVGIYQNGEAVIIPNEQGKNITPSCVAFTATGRLIGDPAKDHAAIDPVNTVFEIKRLMGMKYDDPAVQKDIKNWLFTLVNENSKPRIEVDYQNQKQRFYAEDISGFILSKLKDTAEKYTGKKITKAVITVPAYFNDYQRVATKTAAQIAGMTDVKILTEPTAAAIAHGLDQGVRGKKTILVYDLGGGTFDVTILTVEGKNFNVIATDGDTHLGGKDFDSRLVEFFQKRFQQKHGHDMSGDKKSVSRLRLECEKVKIKLSDSEEAEIDIDGLFKGIDFVDRVTRIEFQEMCGFMFFKTIGHLSQVLIDAKLTTSDIDDLVLVGGSTRIPKIRELVRMYFNGKHFRRDIHPDEAVAKGAVMRAAMLFASTSLSDIKVQDVTPLSLGIEVFGGLMSTVIPRNTPIPAETTKTYQTSADDQTSSSISAHQGERALARDNSFLQKFLLKDIPADLRGKSKFPVTFKLDGDGVLEVAAQPKPGAPFQKMEIRDPCDLPKSEVDRMIADANKFRDHDRRERERVELRNKLYFKCYDLRNNENIGEKCQEMLEWLRDNPDADKEILRQKLGYVELMLYFP